MSINAQMILENDNFEKEQKNASQNEEIILSGEYKPVPYNSRARKYKLKGLTEPQDFKLSQYREKYEKFLKLHNNTATKEVWKIYDHISAELMKEQMDKVLNDMCTTDLDKFLEKVIVDEF